MEQEIRFGAVTLPNVKWSELTERWQQLEKLGFDSIWNIDHFANPYPEYHTQPWFDGWTLLAALATQTKQARIGVLVSSATFRNPYMLVKQALTINHISEGRLELGIGAGGQKLDYIMRGLPSLSSPEERVQRFREVIEIVNQLLGNSQISTSKNESEVNYKEIYYEIKNAINGLQPCQDHIPITLAAHIDESLQLAAAYADTWISYGGRDLSRKKSYKITRKRIENLKTYCEKRGRDFQQMRKAFLVGFTKDKPFESERAFRDFVGAYQEIGITDFIFYYPADEFYHSPTGNDKERFEQIAQEVFPELRKKYATNASTPPTQPAIAESTSKQLELVTASAQ